MPPPMTTTFRTKSFNQGQAIFREGQEGSYACILNAGSVLVSRMVDGEEVVLAELGRGAVFGEMALIGNDKRTATITAKEYTEVVLIDRGRLFAALESANPLVQSLVRGLVERLAKTSAMVSQQHAMTDNMKALAYLLQVWCEANQPDEYGRVRLPVTKLAEYSQQTLHLPAPDMEQILTQLSESDIVSVESGAHGRELVLANPDHVVRRTEYLADRLENQAQEDAADQPGGDAPIAQAAQEASGPADTSGFMDIYELAKEAGLAPHELCQRLAGGDLPKTMVYFQKGPAQTWAKENRPAGAQGQAGSDHGPLSSLEEVLLADRQVLIKGLSQIGSNVVVSLLAGGSPLSRRIMAKNLPAQVRARLPQDLDSLPRPTDSDFRRAVEQLAHAIRIALGDPGGGGLRER